MNVFSRIALLLLCSSPCPALAQSIVPAADGTGTIAIPQGQQIQIRGGTQAGSNLFHSFDRFNLDANQTATFLANPAIQNILGRVVSGEASRINGLIQVNGNANLVLMNPAGILFGSTARLNVPGSFTATTANRIGIGAGEFNAIGSNNYATLIGTPSSFGFSGSGGIFNAGNLVAGQVSLFGGTVLNIGTLEGQTVSIAAVPENRAIRVTPQGSLLSFDLPNSSDIATRTLPELLTGGELQNVTQAIIENGIPTLTQAGTAIVSGKLSGTNVQIAGDRIGLIDATIKGESIQIGGDRQGLGAFPRSQFLFGNPGTQIEGKTVILWSNQATRFHGAITSNNGFIETSGKQILDITDARINAGSGTWLIDPSDIHIVTGGSGTLTAGVFDPPSAIATIDPTTIESALNAGTNVLITTSSGTGGNGDITLSNSITQTGIATASLTLTGRRFNVANSSVINLNSPSGLKFNINQVNPEVNASVNSIQNAIDAIGIVNTTTQINLGAGTYYGTGTPILVNKNTSINGQNFATTTISGNKLARVFQVNPGVNLTLQEMSIADGITPVGGSGGGILNFGNLSLNNVGVRNNIADLNGGGIAVVGAGASLSTFSTFIADNRAQFGGGVFSDIGTTVDLSRAYIGRNTAIEGGGVRNFGALSFANTMFDANVASFAGGGIRNSGTVVVDLTTFQNGTANYGGGISNLLGGTVTVRRSAFINNSANIGGGAIASDGAATIDQSTFTTNHSGTGYGGAISSTDNLSVTRSDFTHNSTAISAGNAGGAIGSYTFLNPTPQVSISGSNFTQNSSYNGGAISTSPETRLTIQGSNFIQNQALDLGGAISNMGTTNITRSSFRNNAANGSADSGGGAIHTQGAASTLTISNSQFLNNRSVTGGAIDSTFPNAITIDNTQIEGNIAQGEAGAILSDRGSVLTITNSQILNNQSAGDAGALYISGQGRIENTIISNNVSSGGNGGGIYTIGSVNLINSNVIGNSAVNGGGFFIDPGSLGDAGSGVVTGTTIANNTTTSNGGGIANTGRLTVSDTTLSNNTATQGGGLFSSATTNLSNTTISGNTATQGGGLYIGNGNADIQSTTIANNQSTTGAVFNFAGTASLRNTIVATNLGTFNLDVSGVFNDLGNNLVGISNGSIGFTVSTLVGTQSAPLNPNLAPLANNGGITQTHALLPNSSAINGGNNNNVSALDQAGHLRIQDGTIDIGAFESTPIPPVPPTPPIPPVPPTPQNIDSPSQSSPNPIIKPNTEAQQVLPVVMELERSLSSEFEQYYGIESPKVATMADIQDTLAKAQQQKGAKSAIIYAVFVPSAITPTPKSGEVLTDQSEPVTTLLRSQLKQSSDRLELVLVTATGRAVRYSTTATRSQVAQQAKLYRLAVSDVEDDQGYLALSKQLYHWLVQPLEVQLQREGIQGLIYCLDEGLRTTPIAAMSDDRGFVVDRYTISMIPSVTLLSRDIHTLTHQPMLAMGADYFQELSPLPAVPTELKLVSEQFWKGTRFLNQDFTLERLLQEKQRTQAGILHLATHAQFNPGKPNLSFIQLWDKPIKLSQMTSIAWANPPLHLLVLSACDTAIDSTDAELGFTGLAAASGVYSVVGSLWEVSDLGTLALMSEFYTQLQKVPTRAEALRRAQIALRNGTVRIENGTLITSTVRVPLPPALKDSPDITFQHPFYWAAFTLVGNPW